jgi:hypothetical protein
MVDAVSVTPYHDPKIRSFLDVNDRPGYRVSIGPGNQSSGQVNVNIGEASLVVTDVTESDESAYRLAS